MRRKFRGIATQDGLTIALRPIKQNPQIAGVVISGYSYSPAFISDLPTTAQAPEGALDFSLVDSIGPIHPADPEIAYDPSLNPKFATKKADGGLAAVGSMQSPLMGRPGGAPLGIQSATPSNRQSFGSPSSGSQFPVSSNSGFQMQGANAFEMRAPGHLQGAPDIGHAGAYRRRLTSFNDYGQSEVDMTTRLDSLNTKLAQEPYAMNSGKTPDVQSNNLQPAATDALGRQTQNYNVEPTAVNGFQQGTPFAGQEGPSSLEPKEASPYGQGVMGVSDSQATMQSPQSPEAPPQYETSGVSGVDPREPGAEATRRFYQAQTEALQAPPQYQSYPAPQSSSAWSGDQTRPAGQGFQITPGSGQTGEDPNAAMAPPVIPQGSNYNVVPSGERPYQTQGGTAFGNQGAPAGPGESTGGIAAQAGYGASAYQRQANDNYAPLQEPGQMPSNQGSYIGMPSNDNEPTQSHEVLQGNHVERLVQPAGQFAEAPQYGREGTLRGMDERNGNMGQRYNSPNMSGGEQGFNLGEKLPVPGRQMVPSLPDNPDLPESERAGQEADLPQDWAPGIHNGPAGLEGMCIDNSTHCSCGMAEKRSGQQEECLFVVREDVSPMICARQPCSGHLICACASGANTLCERSMVKHILVPASVHKHGVTEEPNAVLCKREVIEQGVGVLTPII